MAILSCKSLSGLVENNTYHAKAELRGPDTVHALSLKFAFLFLLKYQVPHAAHVMTHYTEVEFIHRPVGRYIFAFHQIDDVFN